MLFSEMSVVVLRAMMTLRGNFCAIPELLF